jgi:hypothetical protein
VSGAGPQRGPSGRDLAQPRTRPDAAAYLVALLGLYAGVVALLVLDALGPACTGPGCATYRPGIKWALAATTWGFLALVVLAFRFTRSYDRQQRTDGRASSRGWPLAWNYLAAGLIVPAALRVLRGHPSS